MDETLAVRLARTTATSMVCAVSGEYAMRDELMRQSWKLTNLDTARTIFTKFATQSSRLTSYTDADGIAEALRRDADVIIVGRVSASAWRDQANVVIRNGAQ